MLVQANTAFEATIDEWLVSRLSGGSRNWHALLLELPSVYPGTILDSLKRLELLERVSFSRSENGGWNSSPFAFRLWAEGRIPTPHVLDSTWWFGDSALQLLLEEVEKSTGPKSKVLLLGVPTFWHFAKAKGSNLRFRLLDRQRSAEPSEFTTTDLPHEQLAIGKMDLVIMDPPWYPFDMQVFLLAALRNAAPGAKILLSVPPVGTRPRVEEEWQQLLHWSSTIGLGLQNYKKAVLPYVSPLFERNALRAAGIVSYPEEWRRGDLATFEWHGASERLVMPDVMAKNVKWNEAMSGRMRIRWRRSEGDGWRSPLLKEIIEGDVLPSVSRRDPRLASVSVWTSGNRVFGCEGTHILGIITQAILDGNCPELEVQRQLKAVPTDVQAEEIGRTAVQIRDLITIEQQEITDWGTRQNDGMVKFLT
jgi:hypothetical protein